MHTSNVVVAFGLSVEERIRAALAEVSLEARELAALTLVAAAAGCGGGGRAARGGVGLCARVGLTHSGTVRLVDRLAARGLLRRGASTGRRVPLHLTPEGSA